MKYGIYKFNKDCSGFMLGTFSEREAAELYCKMYTAKQKLENKKRIRRGDKLLNFLYEVKEWPDADTVAIQ